MSATRHLFVVDDRVEAMEKLIEIARENGQLLTASAPDGLVTAGRVGNMPSVKIVLLGSLPPLRKMLTEKGEAMRATIVEFEAVPVSGRRGEFVYLTAKGRM